MLKFLRKKNIAKKIFLLLAIIVIPAFVFWGVGPGTKEKNNSKCIGEIFGKKVDIDEFKKAYRTVFIQASLRFGDEFRKIEPFLNLSEQAWDRLILLKEAKNKRIKIKDDEIIKFIQDLAIFQKDEKFDQKIYSNILQYLRVDPREFEEQIRDTIKIEKLYKFVTDNIKLDDNQALDIYKHKNDKVKIDYVDFIIKDFKQKVKFSDNQIKEFYDKNITLFPLEFNKVKDEVKEMFVDMEAKKLAEASALNAISTFKKYGVKDEAGFIKSAKSLKLTINTPKEFTREDYIDNIGMNKNFVETAFNLIPNTLSDIIETPSGFYIIFKRDYIFADEKQFNAEKEKLKEQYLGEKKQKAFDDFFKGLKKRTQLYTLPR
ncbi:MAG: SurA N-terminal domain-containing protein [Candidatus Omnitrophota bacterium]